jgi:hypothetical protein
MKQSHFSVLRDVGILRKITSFRSLKNTAKTRGHRVTKMLPQMLNLTINGINKSERLAK